MSKQLLIDPGVLRTLAESAHHSADNSAGPKKAEDRQLIRLHYCHSFSIGISEPACRVFPVRCAAKP